MASIETGFGKGRPEFWKRSILAAAILLAILMSGSDPVMAGDKRFAREMARQISAGGVPNMAEVTPRLYRRGQPSERGLETLAKMGIGIVVDGRGESGARKREGERVRKLGMRYVEIPWHCPFQAKVSRAASS